MKGRCGKFRVVDPVVGLGLVFGLLCYGVTPAQAATLDVCPSGCTYSTIQSAIDDAVSGVDDVLVGDGTYVENINFIGKAITVQSVNGAASTIIDGNASSSVVTFWSFEGASSVLDGFTITNGSASEGGGIRFWDSSPTITNCIISGNTAGSGGGIRCGNSSPTISNCTISNNSATNTGGGISCYQSSPTITNCTISNNSATNGGGGIRCGFSSSPSITDCSISNNSASWGGGIGCDNNSSPTVTNCTISNNSASNAGGGISCYQSSPTITNCTISNNAATNYGGGIANFDNSSPTITNCTISGNSTTSSGGGIYCSSSSPTITNCTISNNSASWGGGIGCDSSSPTITNCTISDNSASFSGGGIYCGNSSSPTITNCTISANSASGNGGGINCYAYSSPTVVNSILWGDSPDEIYLDRTSSIAVAYSDIQGGWAGIGNINADPLFVGGGDYHLTANSPCIDTGTDDNVTYPTLPADDIDGDARPQGAGYDMGSDEYVTQVPPAAPSRLRVRTISRRKIRLRWRDKSGNEDGFRLERKRGGCRSGRRWREIATVPADTTRYVNRGLRPDTKYSYRVRAYNNQGDSGYSNCRATKTLP